MNLVYLDGKKEPYRTLQVRLSQNVLTYSTTLSHVLLEKIKMILRL